MKMKGRGGSIPLSGPSGCVTSEEEECRQGCGRKGEKQADKPQGETERRNAVFRSEE